MKLLGKEEHEYLVGSSSPSGHSISRHSLAGFPVRSWLDVTWTRTRANRDRSHSFVPSRHLIVRYAFAFKESASSLTEIVLGITASPLRRQAARTPGFHTKVCA